MAVGTGTTRARDLAELLDEVVWRFGGQGPEGSCCGDVSYVEYRALQILAKIDECTMQQLGQQLGFSKSGSTRVVDRLERKGYAQRQRDADDRRVCCVASTRAGHSLLKRTVAESARKAGAALEHLDEGMREILLASLRSFVRALRDATQDG